MRGNLIFGFLILSFSVCFVFGVDDPCALVSQPSPCNGSTPFICTYPSQLLACFQSIQFNATVANRTLQALYQIADLYSFTDLVSNSSSNGSPLNMHIDIYNILDEMAENVNRNSYTLDYQFQREVGDLFHSLYDAHTNHMLPCGYRCNVVRPFDIETTFSEDSDNQRFFLRAASFKFPSLEWVVNMASEYDMWELIEVNGVSAFDYFNIYADEFVGMYKDHTVRFSSLFSRRGNWMQVATSNFHFPDDGVDTFNLTISNGNGTQTVEFPFLAICVNSFTSTEDFMKWNFLPNDMCQNTQDPIEMQKNVTRPVSKFVYDLEANEENIANVIKSKLHMKNLQKLHQTQQTQEKRDTQQKLINPIDSDKVNVSLMNFVQSDSSGIFTELLYNRTQAIWKLKTFFMTSVQVQEVVDSFLTAIQNLERYPSKEVIFDVSGNGGGIICLSLFMMASIVPEWNFSPYDCNLLSQMDSANSSLFESYDFRKSPISDHWMGDLNTFVAPTNYADERTNIALGFNDRQFYDDGMTHSRGNGVSNYTSINYFPVCTNFFYNFSLVQALKKPERIIIVTDGTCGSACSLFVSKFSFYSKGIVVSHGGKVGSKMDTSSFAGGNVLTWSTVVSTTATSKMPAIPTLDSTYLSFNFNEMYLQGNTLPREFIQIFADYHIYMSDAIFSSDLNTAEGAFGLTRLYASISDSLSELTFRNAQPLPKRVHPFVVAPEPEIEDNYCSVINAIDCETCAQSKGVWCPTTSQCVPGHWYGFENAGQCDTTWQYGQCKISGFWLLIGAGIILLCFCCCLCIGVICCWRRNRTKNQKRRKYELGAPRKQTRFLSDGVYDDTEYRYPEPELDDTEVEHLISRQQRQNDRVRDDLKKMGWNQV